MKRIFYEKVGKRYKPVSEYDSDLLYSMSKGCHLVMCTPGGSSYHYNINPNYAAMIAAGKIAEDAIANKIVETSSLRAKSKPLTLQQKAAWENLVKELGEEARCLEWPAATDAAKQAVNLMQQEADKLLTNPAVKKAFDHFIMVCELTKEKHDV